MAIEAAHRSEVSQEIKFHLAELSFESLEERSLKSFFNNPPTSLERSASEV